MLFSVFLRGLTIEKTYSAIVLIAPFCSILLRLGAPVTGTET